VEYDDVLNKQREIVYKLRKAILRQTKGVDFSNIPEEGKKAVAEQSLIQLMLMEQKDEHWQMK